MATKVGELFVELLVDAASGNLSVRQMVGALGDLEVASVATVGIIGKVAETMWSMAKTATAAAVELTALHDVTGADPAIVLKWERAAERLHISSASIVGALTAVWNIQKQIRSGGGEPAFMGKYGIDATKIVDGKRAYKELDDYIKEFAAKGSRYQQLGPALQQTLLTSMFGGNADSIFRLIDQTRRGNFTPEKIGGLNDRQIASLNRADSEWITVKQDLVTTFEKFLMINDSADKILTGAHELLEAINKILDMPSVKKTISTLAEGVGNVLSGKSLAVAMGEQTGANSEDAFVRGISNRLALAHAGAAGANQAGRDDKLTVNIKHNDRDAGHKTFSQRELLNADLETWTNNTGPTR